MGNLIRFRRRPKHRAAGPPSFGVGQYTEAGYCHGVTYRKQGNSTWALQDYGDTVAIMLGSGREIWLSKADALALGEDLAKMARR
jgi:acetoacetate decarboxylase